MAALASTAALAAVLGLEMGPTTAGAAAPNPTATAPETSAPVPDTAPGSPGATGTRTGTGTVELTTTADRAVQGRVPATGATSSGSRTTVVDVTPPVPAPEWRVLPIRSPEEASAGMFGGEGEQHPRSLARSPSDPDRLYLSQDVGQVWRSDDAGVTWRKTRGLGLEVVGGLSVAVDPVDPDVVLLLASNLWDRHQADREGVYRSDDAGESWTLVQHVEVDASKGNSPSGEHQTNIAAAPSTAGPAAARRWYAAVDEDALYRSDDGGRTWRAAADLSAAGDVHTVVVDPTDPQRVVLATSSGLLVSTDGGVSVVHSGGLPGGDVSWVATAGDESRVAVAGDDPSSLWAVVLDDGVFESTDGGRTFTRRTQGAARSVFVHPADPSTLYLTSDRATAKVSRDGGRSWAQVVVQPPLGLDRDSQWKLGFRGVQTGISPDPRRPGSAVAYSRSQIWRTDDGINWRNSSELFTGYNWRRLDAGAAFDPDDPDRFALGLFDVGIVVTDTAGDHFVRSALPPAMAADGLVPDTDLHAVAFQPGSGGRVLLASAGNAGTSAMVRSVDGGRTWAVVDTETALHYTIDFDRRDPATVLSGQKRSDDGGETWTPIDDLVAAGAEVVGTCQADPDVVFAIDVGGGNDTILRSEDGARTFREYASVPDKLAGLDVRPTFAADPADCDVVYGLLGDDLGRFDGNRWQALGLAGRAGDGDGDNFVSSVELDPHRPDTIYAATNAPGRGSMWRSTDGGRTWDDISAGMPLLGAPSLAVHPATGEVLAGSQAGTWVHPPPEADEHGARPYRIHGHTVSYDDVFRPGEPRELPSRAVVTMERDGTFSYDPAGGFAGLAAGSTATDSFDVAVAGPGGATSTSRVTVTVEGTGAGVP